MNTGKYDNANDRNTVIREINALKEYSNIPLEKTRQRIKRARTLVNNYIKDEERKREALDYVESLATHFECLLGGIPCLFLHKTNKSLKNSYRQTMDRSGEIDEELRSREARKKRIALFLRMFEKQEADVEFDAGTFVAMMESVVVRAARENNRLELRFELRSGQVQEIGL